MSERLTIAFLDSWHTDVAVGSGSTAAIQGLARALAEQGHQISTLRPGGGALPLGARRLVFNAGLARRLRRGRFDLIVGFDFDGCFLRPPLASPYVVCLKGVLADEARFESGLTRARLTALARLERRNARHAERVLVTSEYAARMAAEAYGLAAERLRIVPEGVDTSFWSPTPPRGSGRRSPPGSGPPDPAGGSDPSTPATPQAAGAQDASPPVVLSVARQYPRKNTHALIAALPAVVARCPEVHCRVVGGGPEIGRLRGLAGRLGLEDRVELLGALPRAEDVRREYRRATVFCLPSLQEGFGMAFLEAMATGLPVVGSRSGAVPELVVHGETGWLVDGEDPAEIAAALLRLLEDEPLRERLGRTGRARAQRYAWPRVAQEFLSEAVGPGHRPSGQRSCRDGPDAAT